MPKIYHYSPEELPGGRTYDYMITLYNPPWVQRVLSRIFPKLCIKLVPLSKLLEEIQTLRQVRAQEARQEIMARVADKAGVPMMVIDTKAQRGKDNA